MRLKNLPPFNWFKSRASQRDTEKAASNSQSKEYERPVALKIHSSPSSANGIEGERNTTNGTFIRQQHDDTKVEQLVMPSSEPSYSGTMQWEKCDQGQRGAVDKVHSAPAVVHAEEEDRLKRTDPEIDEPTTTTGTAQRALSASVPDDRLSQPTQSEEKSPLCPALSDADDDQGKSTNSKGAEQTERDAEEIKRLRRELSEYRSQIAELQKRPEAQSRGFEGSNNLFSAADKSSDSDIIRTCQRLNAELQQDATYIADCLLEDFGFRTSTTDLTNEQTAAVERASSRIGKDLTASLSTLNAEYIPLLLQIAFQAYLASALFAAASSWTFEPGHHAFIYGIYDKLRSVESQAISGHWRTLARDHSQSTPPESLVSGILTDLSDILVAAGCTAPQSDIISKVTSEFKQRITSLVELAARLGKTFDDVISSDFEVFTARPGDKFEGKTMEDTDGCHAGAEEETVLCATHLGLMKRIPLGSSLWEKGGKQMVTVLKAKVLLLSFLDMD